MVIYKYQYVNTTINKVYFNTARENCDEHYFKIMLQSQGTTNNPTLRAKCRHRLAEHAGVAQLVLLILLYYGTVCTCHIHALYKGFLVQITYHIG